MSNEADKDKRRARGRKQVGTRVRARGRKQVGTRVRARGKARGIIQMDE